MKSRSRMKLVAGVAATLLLSGALSSCSSASSGNQEGGEGQLTGKITVWAFPLPPLATDDDWQPYIESFKKQYPGIDVEVLVKPWKGREETLTTAVVGGRAPDVIYFNPGYVTNFASQDLLVPLDDLRDDWGSFAESALDPMRWQGTLYGSPTLVQVLTSYCNRDVLEAAGIETCPTTWDELREIAPAVKSAGMYLTEYSGTNTLNHTFFTYLRQAGGDVLNDDMTEATFNGPEGVRTMEFIKEMVDNEWVPRDPLSVEGPFEQSVVGRGEAAYVMAADLSQSRQVLNPDVIQITTPLKDVKRVAAGSVAGWSIFNTTEAPEAAKAWVRYLGETDFLEDFLSRTHFLSPRTDIVGLFADDPQIAQGAEYLGDLRSDLNHAQATKFMNMIRPHLQKILLEGADIQTELDAAAGEVNQALRNGK